MASATISGRPMPADDLVEGDEFMTVPARLVAQCFRLFWPSRSVNRLSLIPSRVSDMLLPPDDSLNGGLGGQCSHSRVRLHNMNTIHVWIISLELGDPPPREIFQPLPLFSPDGLEWVCVVRSNNPRWPG